MLGSQVAHDVFRADQVLGDARAERRLALAVDRRRVEALVAHLGARAETGGHRFDQRAQPLLDQVLGLVPEAAHRADQLRLARDDAQRTRVAGLHRTQATPPPQSIGLTLRETIDCAAVMMCAGDQHRVDRQVRMRAVAAAAADRDLDAVGRRHHRARMQPRCFPRAAPASCASRTPVARESARTGRRRSSPARRRSLPRPAGRSGSAVPSKLRVAAR